MPGHPDDANQVLEEYRAYLETLSFIHLDPRLRSEFSMSDIIQQTLMEAWRDLPRIEALDAGGRKHWLRKMLVNNLLQAIERAKAKKRDVRLKKSLDAALDESSCRLQGVLAVDDTTPGERMVKQEQALRVWEALSKLDARQREALILQKYHGWKLDQIAEHLNCTTGAVAGLHARGLKKLRELLPEME
jgi:RNA polymerase sigma-70 factor (subfamily 1)